MERTATQRMLLLYINVKSLRRSSHGGGAPRRGALKEAWASEGHFSPSFFEFVCTLLRAVATARRRAFSSVLQPHLPMEEPETRPPRPILCRWQRRATNSPVFTHCPKSVCAACRLQYLIICSETWRLASGPCSLSRYPSMTHEYFLPAQEPLWSAPNLSW